VRWLKWVVLGLLVVAVPLGALWYTCGLRGCPDPSSLLAYEPGGAPEVLDRDGESFTRLLPVQREVVPLDSLPPYVGEAFIAVEDRRFRSHWGVDLRRVAGALVANVRERGVAEGGSTITMQLARNAFPERLPASQRTLWRKFLETRVAWGIERTFDKDQILGLYLNQIYFGNGATGIAAAARHYFGIPASELTLPKATLLAGMVKAPSHYDPREEPEAAKERRDLVLRLMGRAGFLDPDEVRAAQESAIEVVPAERAVDVGEALPAPWYLEMLRRRLADALGSDVYGNDVRVHSTLDAGLQAAAEEALETQLQRIEAGELGAYDGAAYDSDRPPDSAGSRYIQGAVVVLDARTGAVRALVGGRNFRHSPFNRAVAAERQVGSAFKPFVFAAALDRGIPPSHPLDDDSLSVDTEGGPAYEPTNYDDEFRGRMTAREALAHSRNVPAVRLAQEVGTQNVVRFARSAGLDGDIPSTPSMALGTLVASPLELATAYSAFAALGRGAEPRLIERVETAGGRVIWVTDGAEEAGTGDGVSDGGGEPAGSVDRAVAYILTDMLRDVLDRGTGSAVRAAGYRGPAAGKTGTTQDGADAWFVGYTPELVGVVWIGFDRPAPIVPRATGGALAAPVWGRMMARAGPSAGDWQQPDDVVRLPYDPRTGDAIASDCAVADRAPEDLFLQRAVRFTCPRSIGDADSTAVDSMAVDSLRADSVGVPGDSAQPTHSGRSTRSRAPRWTTIPARPTISSLPEFAPLVRTGGTQ
jgi:penicillin-binding protein 1A